LVGAYALAAHGFVRATNDLDVWVRPTPENAGRVHAALTAFGAPADRFTLQDFTQPEVIVQLGVPPVRIDVLTSISGVQFEAAWKHRMIVTLDGLEVPILGREQLIANKRASGREKDRMDLEWLEGGGAERP
jgi:hypothetical protein